eukprot:CCRYP_001260-RC/>CCRYP_001260-RC protein AED:0.46 eAED:1.00 QI:0/-1/0/1/-1/0/1/0/12
MRFVSTRKARIF